MNYLSLASMVDRAFSLVNLSVEEADKKDIVVLLGSLLSPSRGKRGPEIPLCCLLGLCAGQGSAGVIYFLRVLSPSLSFL